MKIQSALSMTMLFLALVFTAACTRTYAVRNKALVLSVEKFDNEVVSSSKDIYPDPEQQKMFSDFIKKNSEVDVSNIEIENDDGTGDLEIKTPKQSIYPELKNVSGREWKAKVEANMEVRRFKLTLKNINKSWEVTEQKSVPAK